MLTDDDLVRDLRTAFRSAAGDLSYTGPLPRAPRPRIGAPLAALAVPAIAAVTFLALPDDAPTPVAQSPSVTLSPSSPSSAAPLITSTIEFAGYRITYRHARDEAPLTFTSDPKGGVPDDARPVALSADGKAWAGTDPRTGDNAVWLRLPTRNGGRLAEMSSPTWTQEQLVNLLLTGRPS